MKTDISSTPGMVEFILHPSSFILWMVLHPSSFILEGSSFILRSSSFILLAATLLLTSCGFQLRGTANLPYETLHVAAPVSSSFANEFRRAVVTGTQARIAGDPKDAQATLYLMNEAREKLILSLSGGGRVREYQLVYRISYRLTDRNNKILRPLTQISLHRDLSYNDADTLSKESEEALLYRDMQTDAVSQLLRQLQTVQQTTAR